MVGSGQEINPNYLIVPMEIELPGYFISPSTHLPTPSASYSTTYYYELQNFDSVQIFLEYNGAYSGVYDSEYNYLGSPGSINNASIFSVYPTAKYVRFSNLTTSMVNPFMVFYNTTNYIQGNYIMPETENIKLIKPTMDEHGKYINASGVISNGGNSWCTLNYEKILADRYIPFKNNYRNYSGAYTEGGTWLFNLSKNTSIKDRDSSAFYVKGSEQYNNTLLPYFFCSTGFEITAVSSVTTEFSLRCVFPASAATTRSSS